MISSRFFPLCCNRREEEARASSAVVIYKYSFLSGLHNELRKLSGTINTYYISPNEVSGASLAAQKRHFGDCFGNVRKLELAWEQNLGPPEEGNDPNRGACDMQRGSFPAAPSQGPNHSLQRFSPGGIQMSSLNSLKVLGKSK